MVMAMLVMLVALSRMVGWSCSSSREKCPLMAYEEGRVGRGLIIAASQLGKIKTALQLVAVMCLLVHYPYKVYFLGLHEAVVDFNLVGLWTLLLATIVSLISAGQYIKGFFDALDNKRSQTSETFAE